MAKRRRDGSYREPAALRRIRESLTEEKQLQEFRKVFGCDPSSEDQLEVFIEHLTLEMYNAGCDQR
ncbi:hypothetical protein [Limnoglobus roseus]|uniref:Uncharacterized protein n=1 Tax=Limnoglobus roseus TaxID=2598579 RepID=A0A5C1AEY1_9BACT|nr:hypothetical protein [Limnoglobus roseus]QEL15684.1 hypothetical protein PX52LOC_02619 [Limnoglobus roseus]